MASVNSREGLKQYALSIATFRLNHCLQNKYTNWYFGIIFNALLRDGRKNNEDYYEAHHIVPRSISGDTRNTGKRVNLTAREHFVCHLLLSKMLVGKNKTKMVIALHRLVHGNGKVYCKSAHLYEIIKKQHSITASERFKAYWKDISPEDRTLMRAGENNGRYGKAVSQDTRDKISKANKGRLAGNKHPLWGVGHSEESKQKNRDSHIGINDGKQWYHNPTTLQEYFTLEQPQNTILGRQPYASSWRRGCIGTARGKKWYTNHITKETKYFIPGEQPEGFTLGRK